jgi:hypothetical protein
MEEALAAAREQLEQTRRALEQGDARDELLARWVQRRFRADTFAPVERVWRLGVLLLGRSGALYAAGPSIRIDALRHDNHQSNLAAERRAVRAAALAAGIPEGETLDYDAEPIALDAGLADSAGPVILTPQGVAVRWSAASSELVPLDAYLGERAGLLLDPPAGA